MRLPLERVSQAALLQQSKMVNPKEAPRRRRKRREKLLSKPREDSLIIPPRRRHQPDSSSDEEEWSAALQNRKRRSEPIKSQQRKRIPRFPSPQQVVSLDDNMRKRRRSANNAGERKAAVPAATKRRRVVSPLVTYTTRSKSVITTTTRRRFEAISKKKIITEKVVTKRTRLPSRISAIPQAKSSAFRRKITKKVVKIPQQQPSSLLSFSDKKVHQQSSDLQTTPPLSNAGQDPVHGQFLHAGIWTLLERCRVFASRTSRHSYRIFQNVKERLRSTRTVTPCRQNATGQLKEASEALQRLRGERDYWKRRLETTRSKCHPKLLNK